MQELLHTAPARNFQHHLRAQHVGADEFLRARNAAIHMRFGGEMNHSIAVLRHRVEDCLRVAHIADDQRILWVLRSFRRDYPDCPRK